MDPSRSWSTLPCPEDQAIITFFQASTNVVLGDDHKFRFYLDSWLDGKSIAQFVPNLVTVVPKRRQKQRTLASALQGGS
jgi:hypothetical protein